MKILLAVDGSAFTKKMLAYLTTHLDLFSGDIEYTALTVHGALPPRARAAVGREIVESPPSAPAYRDARRSRTASRPDPHRRSGRLS